MAVERPRLLPMAAGLKFRLSRPDNSGGFGIKILQMPSNRVSFGPRRCPRLVRPGDLPRQVLFAEPLGGFHRGQHDTRLEQHPFVTRIFQ